MTWVVRCDACNAKSTARFDGGPVLPPTWKEFLFDDYAVHGCCKEHLDTALQQDHTLTPFSDSSGEIPLPPSTVMPDTVKIERPEEFKR